MASQVVSGPRGLVWEGVRLTFAALNNLTFFFKIEEGLLESLIKIMNLRSFTSNSSM